MNNLIRKYVSNLSKEDIINFCNKEEINISNEELNVIYNSIKNDIDILLSKDSLNYIYSLKLKLSDEVYDKVLEFYDKYKGYIN